MSCGQTPGQTPGLQHYCRVRPTWARLTPAPAPPPPAPAAGRAPPAATAAPWLPLCHLQCPLSHRPPAREGPPQRWTGCAGAETPKHSQSTHATARAQNRACPAQAWPHSAHPPHLHNVEACRPTGCQPHLRFCPPSQTGTHAGAISCLPHHVQPRAHLVHQGPPAQGKRPTSRRANAACQQRSRLSKLPCCTHCAHHCVLTHSRRFRPTTPPAPPPHQSVTCAANAPAAPAPPAPASQPATAPHVPPLPSLTPPHQRGSARRPPLELEGQPSMRLAITRQATCLRHPTSSCQCKPRRDTLPAPRPGRQVTPLAHSLAICGLSQPPPLPHQFPPAILPLCRCTDSSWSAAAQGPGSHQPLLVPPMPARTAAVG